jgi:hypothetical protein
MIGVAFSPTEPVRTPPALPGYILKAGKGAGHGDGGLGTFEEPQDLTPALSIELWPYRRLRIVTLDEQTIRFRLEWRLEPEAFSRREIGSDVGHFVEDLTRQPSS